MIFKPELNEAADITRRMLTALINFNISSGSNGADFRSAVGKVLASFYDMTASKTIGTELQNCFTLATTAGATLNSMDGVRIAMLAEAPKYPFGSAVVNASVLFSLSEQCQIIALIEFTSSIEVDALIDRMTPIFDEIKTGLAELFTVSDYQNVVRLSAMLIQHLSATERQLPRIVTFIWPINYPALTLSNRIYGDGSRSDELIAENQTVHPAFMAREIIALGN